MSDTKVTAMTATVALNDAGMVFLGITPEGAWRDAWVDAGTEQ